MARATNNLSKREKINADAIRYATPKVPKALAEAIKIAFLPIDLSLVTGNSNPTTKRRRTIPICAIALTTSNAVIGCRVV
jgi:hypothetical protein